MKKKLLAALLLGLSLLLGACSNYVEIEELMIVAGAAIDYDEASGEYNVTAEILDLQNSSGQESSYEPTYIESSGASLVEAITHMRRIAGRQLYWGHASVFILSQSVVSHSIEPVLDWFMRDVNARLSSMVVISGTEKASDIYKLKSPVKKSISISLEQILENYQKKGQTTVNVNELVNLYSMTGTATCIPIVNSEMNAEEEIIVIHSYAVLKKDILSGIFEHEDVTYLMLLLKNPMESIISVKLPEFETEIKMQTLEHTVQLDVSCQDGVVFTDVNLSISMSVVGGSGDDEKVRDMDGTKILVDATEEMVSSACGQILDKDIQQYGADILGVGQHIKRNDPKIWRKIEKNWDQMYKEMQYEINVEVVIEKSGEMSPIND